MGYIGTVPNNGPYLGGATMDLGKIIREIEIVPEPAPKQVPVEPSPMPEKVPV